MGWILLLVFRAGAEVELKSKTGKSLFRYFPSYYRKLWIRCRHEKGGVAFRVGHANPGGSRVEGAAGDVEGSREWGCKGSRRGAL